MRGKARKIRDLLILGIVMGLVGMGTVRAQGPAIVLTDQTAAQGLDVYDFFGESNHSLGLAWLDFNNDGWDDLFVVNGMDGPTNLPYHLFRNDGGTLTNVDQLLPPDPAIEMMGTIFADYDNDGDQDIYIYVGVPVAGSKQGNGSPPNQLLKNMWVENGDQVVPGQPLFEDVAAFAGVDNLMPAPGPDGPSHPTTTAAWLDYDRDGFVDLYVGHWSFGSSVQRQDRLFRNLGNGQFEDVTTDVGLDLDNRDALVAIAGHIDSDLWPDLYVGNILALGQDQIFENQAGTSFLDVAGNSPGVGDDSSSAMGLALGDIDLDGDFDVYITDNKPGDCSGANSFYENLGGTGISLADDSACTRGITAGTSWGANFTDLDNDGYEELFVARISAARHTLYRNDRDGTFTIVDLPTKNGAGRGSAVSDFDHDGDMDIAVVNNDGTLQLLRNDTNATYNWVQLELAGGGPSAGGSNVSAIGALVRVTAGGKEMVRQLTGGNSAHSQDTRRLHFGIEDATTIDEIEIWWPSGMVDTYVDIAPNQVYTILENTSTPQVTIDLPISGSGFVVGTLIDFEGHATDPEEGDLTSGLDWTSSIDGSIGAGGLFSTALSEGTHTITASVTDGDGNTGSNTTVVIVTPIGGLDPVVTITAPTDGATFIVTDTISFSGTAADVEDGDLTASLTWTSSIDGSIGTGGSLSTTLSQGTHTITAEVTDSNSNTASTAITVEVNQGTGSGDYVLYSIGTEDGTLFESDENSDVGGSRNSVSTSMQVGDRKGDKQTKVIVSFDTSSLPAGTAIQSAKLRVRRGKRIGTDPFTTHGAGYVDVQTGGFGGDPTLDKSDFEASATAPQSAMLSAPAANLDWSEAVLDAAGVAAINTNGTTQLRLYFDLDDDDDDTRDAIGFFSGDDGDPTNHPQLVVSYGSGHSNHSAARQWNEQLLSAIRGDFARPTVHARNLYHTSVAMWDAWAAYDGVAATVLHHERATATDIEDARAEAISYAAYRMLSWRFANSPSATESLQSFDNKMDAMGYDRSFTSTAGDSPAALGNRIAETIINIGLTDGSNEPGGYENLVYETVNPPLLPDFPGNPDLIDPDRWQPLALDFFIDQSGNPIPGGFPDFLSPEWGIVEAFALSLDDLSVSQRDGYDWFVYHDPGPPPAVGSPEYASGFEQVVEWSGYLDPADGVMIDISPGARGHNTLGTNDGTGRPLNPVTGLPYEPNMVPAGDYYRVLAEFWADGPDSETPPGHWFTLANWVSDHPAVVKKLGGVGPTLGDLEWDVKVYLVMGGAMHDAAIAAWGVKGWYDYIRPVSAIRYLCDNGQSSDPGALSYDPSGIHLLPGHIELVTSETAAPGGIHEHLAGPAGENIGKIATYAWRGPDYIADPDTDTAGVGWILCENWWPYQRPSFVTPPFAGYVSGHSTYSRAAAEVMTLLTGDEFFPGGMGTFLAPENEFLVFEEGPSQDIVLQWATYADASDETSISRIYGGIHPTADDIPGRLMGYVIGPEAFNKALEYFGGGGGDMTFYSIGAEDGTLFESNENSDVGGSLNSVSTSLQVGDRKDNKQSKVVVSFDTSALPEGAVIESAKLRLRRGRRIGTDPFTTHGVCYVDVQTGGFGGDPAPDKSDFEASATALQSATLSAPAANFDWSEASLDAAGMAAIDTDGVTQLRIYFELDDDDDSVRDAIGYISGHDSDSSNHPQLVVTFSQ